MALAASRAASSRWISCSVILPPAQHKLSSAAAQGIGSARQCQELLTSGIDSVQLFCSCLATRCTTTARHAHECSITGASQGASSLSTARRCLRCVQGPCSSKLDTPLAARGLARGAAFVSTGSGASPGAGTCRMHHYSQLDNPLAAGGLVPVQGAAFVSTSSGASPGAGICSMQHCPQLDAPLTAGGLVPAQGAAFVSTGSGAGACAGTRAVLGGGGGGGMASAALAAAWLVLGCLRCCTCKAAQAQALARCEVSAAQAAVSTHAAWHRCSGVAYLADHASLEQVVEPQAPLCSSWHATHTGCLATQAVGCPHHLKGGAVR